MDFNDKILNKFVTDKEQYEALCAELEKDQKEVLPTKSYKGNCSKEFCSKIVDLYLDREFNYIKTIPFPTTREQPIKIKDCEREFTNLMKEDKSWKAPSNLIRYFHPSIVKASVGTELSPYDGWQKMCNDKETFKRFYENRLRCSDWFKEKDNMKYLCIGYVPEFIYGIGLSTSRMFQQVTYFKPALAKYLVKKYLNEFKTVFDPFSGYSGRLVGTLAAGKNYIGQDLCESSVKESLDIWDFLNPYVGPNLIDEGLTCSLSVADVTKSSGKYECLMTCSPYDNIENWPGVKSLGYGCDKWIDICLQNFECERYVFVTDDLITKYKMFVKEQLINSSHFSDNCEYIVVISKEERDEILKGNLSVLDNNDYKSLDAPLKEFKVTLSSRSKIFQKTGVDLFNIFNSKTFKHKVIAPSGFKPLIDMVYDKFEIDRPEFQDLNLKSIKLKDNDKVVVLAFSGGLDSCSQALILKDKGYDVHLFHMSNANRYEGGMGDGVSKAFAEKHGMKLIEAKLSNGDKEWPENPIKNQMIISAIVDYCYDNGYNQIGLGEKEVLTIDEVVAGINVTDSKDINDKFFEGLNQYVENLKIIDVEGVPSKLDKLNVLEAHDSLDFYYSCLLAGRFNQGKHKDVEKKYGISLPKYNCGCFCRKCATQNLMWHYYGGKEFPQEFIDQCWKIMYDNGYSSEKRFFTPDIPLEQRIKNLLEQ